MESSSPQKGLKMKYNIHHRDDKRSLEIVKILKDKLGQNSYEIDPNNPELVITVGGDGTMLHNIHRYLGNLGSIKFIGIHTGTLGFFTEYTDNEIDLFIDDLKTKIPCLVSVPLLEARLYDKEDILISTLYSLNEIRVENIIRSQMIHVKINDVDLENFRGNGLCVSGQIGSTGYNRSLGGAILDDTLQALQLTEISGIHHQHYRSIKSPFIVNPNAKFTFESDDFSNALILHDQFNDKLDGIKKIDIFFSRKKVNFMKLREKDYYQKLRSLF